MRILQIQNEYLQLILIVSASFVEGNMLIIVTTGLITIFSKLIKLNTFNLQNVKNRDDLRNLY